MNARKQKTLTLKKNMPVELFEIRKQFIIGAFLLILTQEDTGSKG